MDGKYQTVTLDKINFKIIRNKQKLLYKFEKKDSKEYLQISL